MAEGSQNGTSTLEKAAPAAGEALAPQVAQVAQKAAAARDDALGLAGAATDLAGVALEQGRNLLGTAQQQATGFADRQKDQAAQSIADLATSLRSTGETFEGRPNIQAFVGSAAEGLEGLANSVRERSFVEIYGEAERYARERPVAVAAGAVAVGFLLARFIKSSAEGLSAAGARATAQGGRSGAARPSAGRPSAA